MRFTKLHASIVASSIWSEPPITCKVWITMLAMAGWDGVVSASVNGLAHLARVSIPECEDALAKLSGPDPYSRDGTTGERIKKVEGGWLILNHNRYRDMRSPKQVKDAAYMREYRSRQEGSYSKESKSYTSCLISSQSPLSGSVEEREREREEAKPKRSRKPKVDAVERPAEVLQEHWDGWLKARAHRGAMPPTDLAVKAMRREAAAAGITLDDAVRLAAENGWQAFRASYAPSNKRPGAKQSIFDIKTEVSPEQSEETRQILADLERRKKLTPEEREAEEEAWWAKQQEANRLEREGGGA